MTTRELILEQYATYPGLKPIDEIKAIYQSVFGCGHFVGDDEEGLDRLNREIAGLSDSLSQNPAIEALGDGFSRVSLYSLKSLGLSPKTLFKLFSLSSLEKKQSAETFKACVETLIEVCENGEIPLDPNVIRSLLSELESKGFPSVSHSDEFRKLYKPAYRVIANGYASLIGLFGAIDRLKEHAIIAIDGQCASGKSTLAAVIKSVYGFDVFHMDDFFLTPEMRTPERLSRPGGNVDYERFLKEVLSPLKKRESVAYRPYDCSRRALSDEIRLTPGKISVVEGAYSLHPELEGYYDLKIFMSCDEEIRFKRILERNGESMFKRFTDEWIPLEDAYFKSTDILNRCDIHIRNQEVIS